MTKYIIYISLFFCSLTAQAQNVQINESQIEVKDVTIQTLISAENCNLSESHYTGFSAREGHKMASIRCYLTNSSLDALKEAAEGHNLFNQRFDLPVEDSFLDLGESSLLVLGSDVKVTAMYEFWNATPRVVITFYVYNTLINQLRGDTGESLFDQGDRITNTPAFREITKNLLSEDILLESPAIPSL